MEIAKLCMQNVMIRGYLVKKVYGIYVHGIKTKIESPHKFMKELREERKRGILERYRRARPGEALYPDVERVINLRLLLIDRKKERWYGLCPYATKEDVPFDHGCQLHGYGGTMGECKGEFTFFLIGKDICKRLEECAIDLGKNLGMDSGINALNGVEQIVAKTEIENFIKNEIFSFQ